MPAAEGTPLVAPQAGSVTWSSYQAAGAGYYLVIRSAGTTRDLVFMHLREGSLLVAPGAAVAAGQAIGQVGQTGDADGPHLHFEIWPAGWKAGQPIDPLGRPARLGRARRTSRLTCPYGCPSAGCPAARARLPSSRGRARAGA